MPPTAVRWQPPRILSEHLAPLPEPLACLLTPGPIDAPAAVAALGARALLDLAPLASAARTPWPTWLAPHQVPAAERLCALLGRYGGALLADAPGLGKSYVALAVALAVGEPFALVVPAVLVEQWRALLARFDTRAPIITHESLSAPSYRPPPSSTALPRLFLIDEAHRFRNPGTNRYRALARLVVGAAVLLVTATPVHNRVGDLCHLLRLFLRDHALTALGVSSLSRAARGDADADLTALATAAARLCVSRSRERARTGWRAGPVALSFPARAGGAVVPIGAAPDALLERLIAGVVRLDSGGAAAGLFRLSLLSQLASSLPAFRATLARYRAWLELGLAATAEGRSLTRRDFGRLFPAGQEDLQLALFPLLLPPGQTRASDADRATVRRLCGLAVPGPDPKADALERMLAERGGKTIVFAQSRATVRHLLRRLRGHRVAAVMGDRGWFGSERATRAEVLRAFAPVAQGAPAPAAAVRTDVLLATDLLSEGLNLQDATRVIHYDVPWSPARLAQRVGRVDRAGSPHALIETVTFLPPPPLAGALAIERRWLAKARAQAQTGSAQIELAGGGTAAAFDWCDRLQQLVAGAGRSAPSGGCAAVGATERAVVLVVRLASQVEAVVVTEGAAQADPVRATALLERAAASQPAPLDRAALERAIRRAAPLVRGRLDAIERARWRAADRDRPTRRLIPWVLAAARRAAARRRYAELARLDALVSRLALGTTAGEEVLLEELLGRPAPLTMRDVLAWHERLPAATGVPDPPAVALEAALLLG
jgi:Helicase conserved C-terminal domain